jgi:hypothetical protein
LSSSAFYRATLMEARRNSEEVSSSKTFEHLISPHQFIIHISPAIDILAT